MEFEHKLLHQFSVAVARRMPYTSVLSICMYEITARPHEDFFVFQFARVCLRSYRHCSNRNGRSNLAEKIHFLKFC